jgi:crotonobetainyl-CoA:carnitine CoA-transferase CaiB-like acyl-CoA transferase
MAIMFAIYERDNGASGKGQEIDVSLYEPLFRLAESQVIGFDQMGIVKQRQGNRLSEDSPRNTYATRDGKWIAISASSQKTFEMFANAIGMPELIDDPRYRTNSSRCDYADELDETIARWFARHDSGPILRAFEDAGVVAGPVLDIRDIVGDPHYRARGNIVRVPDEDFGDVRMQGVVPRFGRTPGAVAHSGKSLGADNETIYRDILGLGPEQVARLRATKTI